MENRDRRSGWKHAKLSGHTNEEKAKSYIETDLNDVQARLLNIVGSKSEIKKVETGGLHEKDVDSILGDKTKAKPDMYVTLENDKVIKVSIKKSHNGQVFLITPERFIKGYEKHYDKIPSNVKKGIHLFWGTHPDARR